MAHGYVRGCNFVGEGTSSDKSGVDVRRLLHFPERPTGLSVAVLEGDRRSSSFPIRASMAEAADVLKRSPPMTPNQNVLALSIRDVTKATSMGRTSIYRLIGQRKLIARKVGGRTLILRSDLDAFLGGLPEVGSRASAN